MPTWHCTCEGLREKIALLGGFQEFLLKFHILEIKFLHEKIIFFDLVFFSMKVWVCTLHFRTLRPNPSTLATLARGAVHKTLDLQIVATFSQRSSHIMERKKETPPKNCYLRTPRQRIPGSRKCSKKCYGTLVSKFTVQVYYNIMVFKREQNLTFWGNSECKNCEFIVLEKINELVAV